MCRGLRWCSAGPTAPEKSSCPQNSVSVANLRSQLLGDVVQQRGGDLLLQGGVAHHQGDELRRVRPVQVVQDGRDLIAERLSLGGRQLHQDLRERPELTAGQPAAQETADCATWQHVIRHVAVRRHVSWRLAAWGIPLPCDVDVQLLAAQKAGTRAQARAGQKKLSRSALHKQNLARARFSPAERRYGHFKQPCQRLCNY
ncbi:hypothetical protein EYF80_047335 [Liparis tanakae]|uniref:Uncharacterized protein n=1 Tax=Liparis tanakae TaxID=230148 RepID=A0A4Z2FNR8_9TELE|nr:hypothetical protein EYF80_047335 [Liparis tanakae]